MNEDAVFDADEVIRIGQLEIRYLQPSGQGNHMGAFELRVPPGSNVPPPHSHDNEELIYVLEGTLRFTVGGQTRDLGPGDSMTTPTGVAHAFSNPHSVMARALVMNTPEISADYFREMAALINGGGPPDKARMMETMKRFGLTPIAPPPAVAAPPAS
ncbi:cupin domain-containing protein [Achromobacter mucicolens]|jgi:quercetin dioxygenase-like cupin family protein|uniref:cupin domain-containing protein n=1 Tax=Achromobacter TaxID=222 RepID=UPI000700C40F|nr:MULTISPECIES: cupin domain-containing protein [Achromobacter]KRB16213.1 cupin [Achromobacter sp. Root170]MDF2861205.1 cupin [Achromobacter mucicolens]